LRNERFVYIASWREREYNKMRALNREKGRPAAPKELKRERQKDPKITKVEERRRDDTERDRNKDGRIAFRGVCE